MKKPTPNWMSLKGPLISPLETSKHHKGLMKQPKIDIEIDEMNDEQVRSPQAACVCLQQ